VGKKIAAVRWPRWPGMRTLDPALIQHPLDLALRNQDPIPEADMAKCAIMQPEVHSRPRDAQDLRQLGRRIMFLNHRDTLQVNPAKKSAGLTAQANSQAYPASLKKSAPLISPPPRKKAEARKFQKTAPELLPGSPPAHSPQTAP
jgi:hypothetical protein